MYFLLVLECVSDEIVLSSCLLTHHFWWRGEQEPKLSILFST